MSVGVSNGTKTRSREAVGAGAMRGSQQHFTTDHLLTDLKGRTISSGFVTISAQAGKFVLMLSSTMVLARLLTPRDFGLVAMVTTVVGFLRVFKDAGLSIATVQREKITHAQVSNLFWINLGVSALGSLALAGSAWIIARFYHNSQLVPIALFLSLTFVISGSTFQHQALLKRQMRFKALAVIEVGSMAFSVVVGIAMAASGYGYWSLVWSTLAAEVASLILTWSISQWRPRFPTRGSGVGPLVTFGAHKTAGDLVMSVARGADNLLIGRFFGSAALGLYSRAGALLVRPLEQLLIPINTVMIPALSRLQSQPERYRATFFRAYEAIALFAFFGAGLLLALARPLTAVLLGPKWQQAAVIFAAFTIAALSIPMAYVSGWLFTSQGRGRDMMTTQVINAFVTLGSYIVGLPFGPLGVAFAFSISGPCLRIPISYFFAGRRGPVKAADLWRIFLVHLPVWAAVVAGTALARSMVIHLRPVYQLLICAPVGVIVGIALILILSPQRRVAVYLFRTLREVVRLKQTGLRTAMA